MRTETAPWLTHGPLKISADGHFLVHEDGTPFFWLGDTAWMLNSLSPEDIDTYLGDRCTKRFNVIQISTAPTMGPDFYGNIPVDRTGPVVLNENYWAGIDSIIEKAGCCGLHIALLVMWGRDADRWFDDPLTHNYDYGKMIGERYRSCENVFLVASGEFVTVTADESGKVRWGGPISEEHRRLFDRVGQGLYDGCRGDRLISIHGNQRDLVRPGAVFHECSWLHFHMNQSHSFHELIAEMLDDDWNRADPKPGFNSEPQYEDRPLGFNCGPSQWKPVDAWAVRFQAYWSVFHAPMGYAYGHNALWHMNTRVEIKEAERTGKTGHFTREQLDAPGAYDMTHLYALMERHPITAYVPDQTLLGGEIGSDGTARDLRVSIRGSDSSWAYVYTTQGKEITVHMNRFDGPAMAVFWFQPDRGAMYSLDGEHSGTQEPPYTKIPSGPGADDTRFHPPGEPGEGKDWVLVLETAADR